MSELFLEIAEDIRRERFDKIWRKVGFLAVWGSVVIIASTAGYVGWDSYRQSKLEENTSKLLLGTELIAAKKHDKAFSVFSSLSDDHTSPYYPFAMLQKAQAQELNGDLDGAKKTYMILAKGSSEFSELAKLKSAEKDATIKVATDSVFYYTFAENNAWKLLRIGKKSEAIEIFAALQGDRKTPRSIIRRVDEVLRIISPKENIKKISK